MAPLLRVLIIEDDEDDFRIVREMLREVLTTRYDINWVKTYREGLDALGSFEYEVCLLDYELGEKNGLNFLKGAAAGGCQVPIIVLTGTGSYEIDLQVMHAGAADYLVKDQISPPLLERSIRYAISQRSVELELRASMKRYQETEKALSSSQERYRTLFTECPISLSEDDFSEIKSHIDLLRVSGIGDFRAYFDAHPEDVKRCARAVKFVDVNRATLDLYGAESIEEFRDGLDMLFIEESYHGFKEALIALAEGKTRFEVDTVNRSLGGEKIQISARISVPSGYEATLSRVFISIVDITKRKRAEEDLRKSQGQLKRLSSQLLNVQEEERKEIANEIHDSVGQSLHAIKVEIQSAIRQLSSAQADTQPLRDLISKVDLAIEEVRSIYTTLRPSLLDDLGILAAIRWFLRETQRTFPGIRIEEEISVREEEVREDLKVVIFRTVQAALDNVGAHSRAGSARVSLHKTESLLELKIEDDGVGLDWEDGVSLKLLSRGIGLATMQERVESSGGTFVVKSARGEGTTVRATWDVGMAP